MQVFGLRQIVEYMSPEGDEFCLMIAVRVVVPPPKPVPIEFMEGAKKDNNALCLQSAEPRCKRVQVRVEVLVLRG